TSKTPLALVALISRKLSTTPLFHNVHGYNISSTTVWRVLKAAGYNKTKPTRKPGLTKKMRQERL
ncbi:HTH-Tnp-Tc3-2 domain containing protein, partial [Pyrenophora tritici-repentis]